jgi:hypothetical protein
MDTHATKTQEELIEKIQTLQILLEEMKEEKEPSRVIGFSLGRKSWQLVLVHKNQSGYL